MSKSDKNLMRFLTFFTKRNYTMSYCGECLMTAIKDIISKRWVYFRDNLSFMLTLIITYVFGSVVVYLNYDHQRLFSNVKMDYTQGLSIIMDNLIPTTVVYILGCLVNNMIEIVPILQGKIGSKSENKSIVFNIFTLISLPLYVCFYCVYIYHAFSIALFSIGVILTVIMVILNFKGYKEMHPSCTRSIA